MPQTAHAVRAAILVLCLAVPGMRAAPPDPAAAAASGDVLLLDFAASWCGPCRQMAGLVSDIAAAGWPVRHVDVDREQDLVRRFGVTGVPCYVLLVKGREVGRIDGATTREGLEQLLAQSGPALGGPPPARLAAGGAAAGPVAGIPLPVAAAAAPLATEPRRQPSPARPAAEPMPPDQPPQAVAGPLPAPAGPGAEPAPPLPAGSRGDLERRLLHATARLRVEDGSGVSWGTGTVIDCRQGEALILTCGHIFRDSAGKGRVAVDLFAPDAGRGIAGQVVAWDLKRDLALVSVFTEAQLEPVRVGDGDRRVTPGDPVVTVGCNGGADPTLHHSRVTAVDKYLGPPNVQVAGQPVQGRSGGGLFAIDGTLVGVCNAADPADNEGLFAALPAIHEQLDESGLAFVYRAVYPSGGLDAVVDASAGPPLPTLPAEMPDVSFDRRSRSDAVPTASTGPVPAAAVPPVDPAAGAGAPPVASPAAAATGGLSAGERALVDHVRRHGGRAEVICIVRPHDAAGDASEVFVLKDSSRGFVDRLAEAHAGTVTDRDPPAPSPAPR